MDLYEQVIESAEYVRSRVSLRPQVAIILGTGLSGLVEDIKEAGHVPYNDIPHFVEATVESHPGSLVIGHLCGKPVVAMQGRFHYYEGYSLKQVTFPVRVMRKLGADVLIVSNVCGGLNPNFEIADIMLIVDHINLMGANPLVGVNDSRLGPRFPDMCEPYNKELIEMAEHAALSEGIRVHRGVYAAMTGPSLETRAEYRMLRTIGADAIGMSTVPEVIVAVQSGFKTLGLSIISDMCLPDALEPVEIEKIIAAGERGEPKLRKIVQKVVAEL